jgi:DNA-binding PadR family transcriptional regulator
MASEINPVKTIDSLILSLLARKPMYGYQLIKETEEKSGGVFKFREGTLYPALHRLERAKFIQGKWQVLPKGQQRKYYFITEKGLRALGQRKSEWLKFSSALNAFLETG